MLKYEMIQMIQEMKKASVTDECLLSLMLGFDLDREVML